MGSSGTKSGCSSIRSSKCQLFNVSQHKQVYSPSLVVFLPDVNAHALVLLAQCTVHIAGQVKYRSTYYMQKFTTFASWPTDPGHTSYLILMSWTSAFLFIDFFQLLKKKTKNTKHTHTHTSSASKYSPFHKSILQHLEYSFFRKNGKSFPDLLYEFSWNASPRWWRKQFCTWKVRVREERQSQEC